MNKRNSRESNSIIKKEDRELRRKLLKEGIEIRLYWTDAVWASGLALMFIASFELFYRMIVKYNGKYPSDVGAFTHRVVTNGEIHTRFVETLFQVFYDLNHSTSEMNIYLAAVIVAILILNFVVVRYFLKREGIYDSIPRRIVQAASFAALFTGPIYFPVLHEWFYLHSFCSFAWHSPSYQSMVMFSLASMLCFFAMFLDYEEGISVRWWIAAAVTGLLSAYVKPSHIIDFIPAMVILFLIELFSDGKEGIRRKFPKLFVMGCALIPAGIYTLWLNTMEFGDVTKDGEEHHVIIGLHVMLSHKGVLTAFVFGITFAIIVFAVNFKKIKDNKYLLTLLVFLMGVVQWSFVTESGENAKHGNFDWGMMFGCYFITLASYALMLWNIYDRDSVFGGDRKKRRIYFIVLGVVLTLSILSQLNYFMIILSGRSYMR